MRTVGWSGWVGLLARLVLAGVMLVAGTLKVTDITATTQTVLAYELFGYDLARGIAVTLPVVEIALGLLLLTGLLTRPAAVATGILMLIFMAGIVSAWARGLSIDCGCFSTGGQVDPEETTYGLDLARDALFLALATWLAIRPRTPFALDSILHERPMTPHATPTRPRGQARLQPRPFRRADRDRRHPGGRARRRAGVGGDAGRR